MALLALGLLTWTLVNITWVFFRAKTFDKAGAVLQGMFGLNATTKPILASAHFVPVAVIVAGIVVAHWLMRRRTLESALARTPPLVLSLAWGLMLFAIVAAQGVGNAFIYFQF